MPNTDILIMSFADPIAYPCHGVHVFVSVCVCVREIYSNSVLVVSLINILYTNVALVQCKTFDDRICILAILKLLLIIKMQTNFKENALKIILKGKSMAVTNIR